MFSSTKIIPLGSCAFRQWRADSHCKFIHGYRLTCKIWFCSDELDERNWVYDFGGCKHIKQVLEEQFDHTLCIAKDDPCRHTFLELQEKNLVQLRIMDSVGIEKTAEWIFNKVNSIVKEQTNERVWVSQVEVWEHEQNSAIYKL